MLEPAPKTSAKGRRGTKRPSPSSKKEEASEDPTSTKKLPDEVPSATKVPKIDAKPPPPGGPVEIVFSFDTTGSMYPCLTQVKKLHVSSNSSNKEIILLDSDSYFHNHHL